MKDGSKGMRSIAMVLLLMLVCRSGQAQTPAPSRQQQYEQQRKSPALALTIEALCPIAGMGGFYGGETDKATLLAVLSGVTGGLAVGSVLWLIHLDNQNSSGVGQVTTPVQQGAAISVLVTSAVVYLLARASGLVVASEATTSYNLDLQQRLGVRPDGTVAGPTLGADLALPARF
jgi:hypothetical protein